MENLQLTNKLTTCHDEKNLKNRRCLNPKWIMLKCNHTQSYRHMLTPFKTKSTMGAQMQRSEDCLHKACHGSALSSKEWDLGSLSLATLALEMFPIQECPKKLLGSGKSIFHKGKLLGNISLPFLGCCMVWAIPYPPQLPKSSSFLFFS